MSYLSIMWVISILLQTVTAKIDLEVFSDNTWRIDEFLWTMSVREGGGKSWFNPQRKLFNEMR